MKKSILLKGLFCYAIPIVVGSTIALSVYNRESRTIAYERAWRYAEQTIGDKKAPLDNEEIKIWHTRMFLNEGERPSKNDLQDFIKRSQDEILLENRGR